MPRVLQHSLRDTDDVIRALESIPAPPLHTIPWKRGTLADLVKMLRDGKHDPEISLLIPKRSRASLVALIGKTIMRSSPDDRIPYNVLPDGRYVLFPAAQMAKTVMEHLALEFELRLANVALFSNDQRVLLADPSSTAGRKETVEALRQALARVIKRLGADIAAIKRDVRHAVETVAPVVENLFVREAGMRSFRNHWRSLNLNAEFKKWEPIQGGGTTTLGRYVIAPLSGAQRLYSSKYPAEAKTLKNYGLEGQRLVKLHKEYTDVNITFEETVRGLKSARLMLPTLFEIGYDDARVAHASERANGELHDIVRKYIAAANELVAKYTRARPAAAPAAATTPKATVNVIQNAQKKGTTAATRVTVNKVAAARDTAAARNKAAAIRREEAATWSAYAARQEANARAARQKAAKEAADRENAAWEKMVAAWATQAVRNNAARTRGTGRRGWAASSSGTTAAARRGTASSAAAKNGGNNSVRAAALATLFSDAGNANRSRARAVLNALPPPRLAGGSTRRAVSVVAPSVGRNNSVGVSTARVGGRGGTGRVAAAAGGAGAWAIPAVIAAGAAKWWKGSKGKAATAAAAAGRGGRGQRQRQQVSSPFDLSRTRGGKAFKPLALNT